MQIVLLYSVANECSAVVSTKEKLIGVNANHHAHRRRFSIAHELGHIIMRHPPESKCTKAQIAVFNMEADCCASELLMPLDRVPQFHGKAISVLARMFDVSEEAMARKVAMKKGT